MPPLAKLPGGMAVLSAPFRVDALARRAFKPFARTHIPDELIDSWMEPSKRDRGVRRDLKKVTTGMNRRHTLAAAEKLRGSELPIPCWPGRRATATSDLLRRTARRQAGNAKIVRIPDSKTFVPLDQPLLAEEIAQFAPSSDAYEQAFPEIRQEQVFVR